MAVTVPGEKRQPAAEPPQMQLALPRRRSTPRPVPTADERSQAILDQHLRVMEVTLQQRVSPDLQQRELET